MYFSRVVINPHLWNARRALASLERLHAIVARATSEAQQNVDGSDERPLWRLDQSGGGKGPRLYIVSRRVPDLGVLMEQLGTGPQELAFTEYEPFLDQLRRGQEWGFRCRANPTKSIGSGQAGVRGRRTGIVSRDEQLDWFFDQARRNGFHMPINRMEAPEVLIKESTLVSFKRHGGNVTLSSVVFDGVLAIDDPDALKEAMITGVGRGKGYGFGLLTLVPLAGKSY